MRALFTDVFLSKSRTEWETIFDGTDACCTPVLEYPELESEAGREGDLRPAVTLLESEAGREGDQRPAVTLVETPCLAVVGGAKDARQGQGPGVPGDGYVGIPLRPGDGGEAVLQEWLGWSSGKEFEVLRGGLVLKSKL
ncbi:Isopenicillin N epimerase component 2 like protein [Verticillium longisporum]|nr:Isopenicillin N epimerase component 2 like protein [Verticillium longisporum]